MNPELRRNLWLEFGLHRRIAAPAVLLLVMGLFAANTGAGEDWRAEVHPVALGLTFVILFLWGTRQASVAVIDELRDRTWDLQRLSALGPWAMTWGKLAGAAVFPWYAGGLCLAAVAFTAPGVSDSPPTGRLVLAIVASALALHGAAMAASLLAARKEAASNQRFGTLFLVAVAFMAMWVMPVAGNEGLHRPVAWYGARVDRITFIALSACAFAFWGVFGAYRAMCRELQLRTVPWAWPAFAAFVAAWLAGFAGGGYFGAGRAFVAFGLAASVLATYFALFGDLTTVTIVRRVLVRVSARQWRRALEEMPLWPATLALAAAFALAAPAVFADAGAAGGWLGWRNLQGIAAHAPLALVLLTARDCAILAIFAFAPRPRRVEATAIVYILMLSWLLPGLLQAIGMHALALLLMPLDSVGGPRAAAVFGVQAAIAWGLAGWRWKRNHGPQLLPGS